jgi:hypothetical protein
VGDQHGGEIESQTGQRRVQFERVAQCSHSIGVVLFLEAGLAEVEPGGGVIRFEARGFGQRDCGGVRRAASTLPRLKLNSAIRLRQMAR